MKKPKNLSEEEAFQVEAMLIVSDRLRQAYRMKNEFHKLLECKSRDEAKKQLGTWNMMATGYGLPEFQACTKTFLNWQEEILTHSNIHFTMDILKE